MTQDQEKYFYDFLAIFMKLSEKAMKPLMVLAVPADLQINADNPCETLHRVDIVAPELRGIIEVIEVLEEVVNGNYLPKELLQ